MTPHPRSCVAPLRSCVARLRRCVAHPRAATAAEEEDIKLLTVALVRTATDTGERVTLADAAARFGIDLDELAEEDADDEEG